MSPLSNQKRPRTVTIVLWGVFLFGAWNLGRVIALATQLPILAAWPARIDPVFRLVMAALWAVLFWALTWALWQKRPFTRQAIPLTILLYTLYELLLLIIFAQSTTARQTWAASAILHGLTLLYCSWALNRHTAHTYYAP